MQTVEILNKKSEQTSWAILIPAAYQDKFTSGGG